VIVPIIESKAVRVEIRRQLAFFVFILTVGALDDQLTGILVVAARQRLRPAFFERGLLPGWLRPVVQW
jgi:hypothetical protein